MDSTNPPSDYETSVSKTESDDFPLPLLQTKLHRPPIAGNIIPRAQLIEELEKGAVKPVTLIAAPAGYGKSILASQWLEISEIPGAWVSLDQHDNDLRLFLEYILEAVKGLFPQQAMESRSLLNAAELPPVSVISRYFLNDLEALPDCFILVLDDFHHIHDAAVHDFVAELLVHPSSNLHLVLLTRRDPPLPLHALRSKGMLTEINTAQLRFNVSETKIFLERFLHSGVADKTAQVLEEKIEGWVTGLHLAVLSIRDEADQDRVIAGLMETSQYVQDYLIQEVISQVPPQFRPHLLQTAILDRFCAPLCDAVSAEDLIHNKTEANATGHDFIDWLMKTHLFAISLDTINRWFRYHHLFQELLKRHLIKKSGARQIQALHSRASAWFDSEGLITESIGHALASGDVGRAAEIVESHRYVELIADRWYVLERWLKMLPEDTRQERPKLLLTEAWIRNMQHQLARAMTLVEKAASLLQEQTADTMASGELSFLKGYVLYFEGQAEQSLQLFEEAVPNLTSGTIKSPFLGEAELMLGLARCMVGQKGLAIQALEARIHEVESSEIYLLTRLIAGLDFIYLLCGDLLEARVQARRLQSVSKKHNMRLAEAWSYYFKAYTYLQTGELVAASLDFAKAVELRYVLEPRAAVDALAGLALTQQLLNLDDDAAESCRQLQEFALELNERNYLTVAKSCQARLSVMKGRLQSALEWGRSLDDSPEFEEIFLWLEAPSITQARVLIAVGKKDSLDKANAVLSKIRRQSERLNFTCQTIEVSVLQALVLEKMGRADEALDALKEVVILAGPLGWVRPFVEAGPLMADLLRRLHRKKIAVEYTENLLASFSDDEQISLMEESEQDSRSPRDPVQPFTQTLVEPLTNREMDVLEMLAQRLQTKEIADKLSISSVTVKSHLKNIYQKLNTANRREAVEKAKALGLL